MCLVIRDGLLIVKSSVSIVLLYLKAYVLVVVLVVLVVVLVVAIVRNCIRHMCS